MDRGTSPPLLDPYSDGIMTLKEIKGVGNLVHECEVFLAETKKTLGAVSFGAFGRVRAWRTKRRDNKAAESCENIIPRIKIVEASLRKTIGDVAEKKEAFRDQAKHLVVRLETCVIYNKDCYEKQLAVVEESRGILGELSSASACCKGMVSFNGEILRQRNMQSMSKGKGYVPWGARGGLFRPVTERDYAHDKDHLPLTHRLERIREVKEHIIVLLNELLEIRETHTANCLNCEEAQTALIELLRADNQNVDILLQGSPKTQSQDVASSCSEDVEITDMHDEVAPSVASKSSSEEIDERFYDHSQCSDCAFVHAITCDCATTYQSLYNRQLEATRQLEDLVDVRERIIECMNSIESATDGKPPVRKWGTGGVKIDEEHSPPPDPTTDMPSNDDSGLTTGADCEEPATASDKTEYSLP